MFDVLQAIDALGLIEGGKPKLNSWWALYSAKQQLEALFNQSIYSSYLRISREKANTLHTTLARLADEAPPDNKTSLSEPDAWIVKFQKDQFRLVFISEISTLPAFLVSPKEGFDIALLVDQGTALFPSTLTAKAPEAVVDALEAGKALAYQLSTACGFHTFRVLESVLKHYWDAVTNQKTRPNLETIGNYADCLEKGKHGDPKIWETLKQIAKLHRNPLIHPEVILSVEEAIDTLGIVRSASGAMLRHIPDVPPTSGSIASMFAE